MLDKCLGRLNNQPPWPIKEEIQLNTPSGGIFVVAASECKLDKQNLSSVTRRMLGRPRQRLSPLLIRLPAAATCASLLLHARGCLKLM
jgi:hypothetical protein